MITLALMTIGSAGMYVVSVALPAVQAEFGATRAEASLPYTLQMIGFGLGCLLAGRLTDRFGLVPVVRMGAVCLGAGFALSGLAASLWLFALVQGVLVGLLGAATSFVPLVADTTLWFVRRRGIAVAVCASGNYVAGALWPPIVQPAVQWLGWRHTYMALGLFSLLSMLALSRGLRGRSPAAPVQAVAAGAAGHAGAAAPAGQVPHGQRPFGLAPRLALALLCVAGTACCVAMAMPQVHIVAYCGDLGYGVARGAEMLSLMLGCGIVSRLVSGAICDRIGGVRTLLLGSLLQGLALLLFIPFDGLLSLYLVSALFGLFQGGIVPSYAIIVREHFAAARAATTTGWIIMFTLFGMALGGWMSGKVFDLTGSYHAAFLNGIAWNALNFSVALFLCWRTGGRGRAAPPLVLPAASKA
ncbi:MFS transporter [Aquabacterium sp. OR-4]|nr:MFS transporter [Aquabacterium sp. OR-4]MDT7835706.1 MFS transporter [Aquabacterium sp. OR-4]